MSPSARKPARTWQCCTRNASAASAAPSEPGAATPATCRAPTSAYAQRQARHGDEAAAPVPDIPLTNLDVPERRAPTPQHARTSPQRVSFHRRQRRPNGRSTPAAAARPAACRPSPDAPHQPDTPAGLPCAMVAGYGTRVLPALRRRSTGRCAAVPAGRRRRPAARRAPPQLLCRGHDSNSHHCGERREVRDLKSRGGPAALEAKASCHRGSIMLPLGGP